MRRKVLSKSSSKFGRGSSSSSSSSQEYEPLENHISESTASLQQGDFVSNSDHKDQDQDEALRRKMQNQLGFSNGTNFRIVSVGDSSVMEVMGDLVVTRPRTDDKEKVNLQIFTSTTSDSGHYNISSHHQKSDSTKMVWDFYPHRGKLMQKKQSTSARGNQQWISEKVPGNEATYFILKAPEGTHCLKNMGAGNQIEVIEKTPAAISNPMTHWRLETILPNFVQPQPQPRLSSTVQSQKNIKCSIV